MTWSLYSRGPDSPTSSYWLGIFWFSANGRYRKKYTNFKSKIPRKSSPPKKNHKNISFLTQRVYNVMWCDVMWCDVMWCDVMWCDVMWCYTLKILMLRYVMRCDVMWCAVMCCNVIEWRLILCNVLKCDVMWCDVTLCYVM